MSWTMVTRWVSFHLWVVASLAHKNPRFLARAGGCSFLDLSCGRVIWQSPRLSAATGPKVRR